MTDLLDLLAEADGTADLIHVLLPNMAYSCGQTMLEVGGHFQVGVRDWAGVTCPGCKAIGLDETRQTIRAQQL